MITIEDYNEKCIAVFGNFTGEILTRLKALNGLENTKLKSNDSDIKRTGWVFPKNKRAILETQLSKYMQQNQSETQASETLQEKPKLNLPPPVLVKSTQDSDVYSKKEINAIIAKLVSRIEALETELGYSKTQKTQPKRVIQNDDEESDQNDVPLFKQLM